MNKLLNDLQTQIGSYYENIVELLPKLVIALIVFLVLLFIANRTKTIISRRLVKEMDDPLLANFLSRTLRISLIGIALVLVLQIVGLGSTAGGLLASAGVGAFIVGFAFKDIGENLLAGLMMAFNRPFRIGDTVELNGIKGKVITLNFRDTQIKSFDGKDIFIPNANIIKNPVINYTIDGFLRYDFVIGLDYGSQVEPAQKIVMNILNDTEGVLQGDKKPDVQLTQLSESTMDLTAYYWIDTFDAKVSAGKLKTSLMEKCLKALEEAGFYLPGKVVELKNYNNVELKAKSSE